MVGDRTGVMMVKDGSGLGMIVLVHGAGGGRGYGCSGGGA